MHNDVHHSDHVTEESAHKHLGDNSAHKATYGVHDAWLTADLPLIYLFKSCVISDNLSLLSYCVVTVIFSFANECLKFARLRWFPSTTTATSTCPTGKCRIPLHHSTDDQIYPSEKLKTKYGRNFIGCLLYGVQLMTSYLLMLIAMTFNIYIITSIVVGAMVGMYVTHLPWKKWCTSEPSPEPV